jgi:hypothetical protein
MTNGDYSGETAEFDVDGHRYKVSLLNVEQCFKLQVLLGNQLGGLASGKGISLDPDLLWQTAKKLLSFAEVDGQILDINKHFSRKIDSLNFVILEALKANAPDFFSRLGGSVGSAIAARLKSASEA